MAEDGQRLHCGSAIRVVMPGRILNFSRSFPPPVAPGRVENMAYGGVGRRGRWEAHLLVAAAIFLSSCVAYVLPLPVGMARDEGVLGRGWRERGGMEEGGGLLAPPSLESLIDEAEAVMGEHHTSGFASLRSALEREAGLGVSGQASGRGRHHHHRHRQGSPQEPSSAPQHAQDESRLSGGNHSLENLPGAYYSFLPTWAGAAKPGSPAATWSSPCFSSVSATTTTTTAASLKGTGLQVIIKTSGGGGKACTDSYLLATTRSWHIVRVSKEGTTKQPWSLKKKKRGSTRWDDGGDEEEDLEEYGVRIFRFLGSVTETVEAFYETVLLFKGALKGVPVPKEDALRNLAFLKDYARIEMPPRTATRKVQIDESLLHSGDMLGIVRLDGLDPLIMWGTGSRLGHTAVVLKGEDGLVYVAESQDKTSYWPRASIQKTPYAEWLSMADAADYNVVWLPLSREARARFNESAALEAFQGWEGLSYGFNTLLWGWIDTAGGNFPWPLHEQLLMVGLAWVEPLLSRTGKPSVCNQAFGQRLGVDPSELAGLTTLKAYAIAREKGVRFGKLISMPEQDAWVYPAVPGYRAGSSMVCNVFVCRIWKAAGLFDADVNCGEFTPLDTYQLSFFAPVQDHPPVCNASLCQILGDFSISLPTWNTVDPFTGMRESCAGTPPAYEDRAPLC